MDIYGRYWCENQETSGLDEEVILEEVTSWKLRNRNHKYRFPEAPEHSSELFTKPPKVAESTHSSDKSSRKKKKKKKTKSSSSIEGEEFHYHTPSTVRPSSESSDSCSSCSGCSQRCGLDTGGLLDISCCSHTDREFWAGFKKGFRDANKFRHCCNGSDSSSCSSGASCIARGDA
ncbi:hypothetical protein TWF718_010065 [Orbilia javanica]|uniref:Uncharacterized protein n=1 Tax=Orbilia javanica TaxID=47235 RepID=A0AAN8MQ28_9PEZI